jgi:hypothetical protein
MKLESDVSLENDVEGFFETQATYEVDSSFSGFMYYLSSLLLRHSHKCLDSSRSILCCKGDDVVMKDRDLTSEATLIVRSLLRENGYSEKAIKNIWKWYSDSELYSSKH